MALEPGLPYAAWLKKKYGFEKVKVVPYDGGVARFVADKGFAQQCFITSEPIAARRQGEGRGGFGYRRWTVGRAFGRGCQP